MPFYPETINSKLPKVGTTIFTVISRLAAENNAINLGQGFPDFMCSEEMIERVNNAMRNGNNQYAPMPGVAALREVISEKTLELYGSRYNPDTEITITAGATQAIFTAIQAMIHKNDEVIIFEPAYDCYEPAIELSGGKTIALQLKAPHYTIDWQEVKKNITQKTKMIIINTPHNPTGAMMNEADMHTLGKLVENTDIKIVSDEVYEHIIFDGNIHQSVTRFPGLASRSFVISSFGKTFHTTGWKIGYCVAPQNLMAEFRKVHQFNVFAVNTPIQIALSQFLKDKKNYLDLGKFYQQKRDLFLQLIKKSRFYFLPTPGTYFQLLQYEKISVENDKDFASRLIKEMKIASVPISAFYNKQTDNKVLRFCFAKKEETLEKAAEILCRI